MFYKLEAFTYEGCPVIGNLDTETPYKEKEFFFTTLAEAEERKKAEKISS